MFLPGQAKCLARGMSGGGRNDCRYWREARSHALVSTLVYWLLRRLNSGSITRSVTISVQPSGFLQYPPNETPLL